MSNKLTINTWSSREFRVRERNIVTVNSNLTDNEIVANAIINYHYRAKSLRKFTATLSNRLWIRIASVCYLFDRMYHLFSLSQSDSWCPTLIWD